VLIKLILAAFIIHGIASNTFQIPKQYQGNRTLVVHFTTQEDIEAHCGKMQYPFHTMGCELKNEVYVPNPCTDPGANDPNTYTHLLCHEIAHTNGWTHPN
jgi:hypothetical protein